MMRASSVGSIAVSTVLHAAVLVALCGMAWLVSERTNPARAIILVPRDRLVFPGGGGESAAAAPAPVMLQLRPMRVAALPIPSALPAAEPERRPSTQPVADGQRQVAPRPTRGSYDEFLRQHGTVQVRGSATHTVIAASVPQIDPKTMVDELLGHGGPAAVSGDGEPAAGDEAAAYIARLVEALRAAFDVPGTLDALFVAKVSFLLTGDGLLTDVQLVRSSGNADYDRAVLAAFRSVRPVGQAPKGHTGRCTINFRLIE
jgi:TonB family protein